MGKLFFYLLVALALVTAPHRAYAQGICDNCREYENAKFRKPIPTNKPLTCANFTLPQKGGNVLIKVYKDDKLVLSRAKEVKTREGQFCYPTSYWRRFGEPTKVYFCSEHSVTLWADRAQIGRILSGRGTKSAGYACLRGIEGCGGVDNVSIPADQLD
jgi:hypothetical protein